MTWQLYVLEVAQLIALGWLSIEVVVHRSILRDHRGSIIQVARSVFDVAEIATHTETTSE